MGDTNQTNPNQPVVPADGVPGGTDPVQAPVADTGMPPVQPTTPPVVETPGVPGGTEPVTPVEQPTEPVVPVEPTPGVPGNMPPTQ